MPRGQILTFQFLCAYKYICMCFKPLTAMKAYLTLSAESKNKSEIKIC